MEHETPNYEEACLTEQRLKNIKLKLECYAIARDKLARSGADLGADVDILLKELRDVK